MRSGTILRAVAIAVTTLGCATGGGPSRPARTGQPTALLASIHLVADEPIRTAWPHLGAMVSAPIDRSALVPGQRIAITVRATGDDARDYLLGLRFALRIRCGAQVVDLGTVRPAVVRWIVPRTMRSVAGQWVRVPGEHARPASALAASMGIAVMLPDWIAPEVTAPTPVTVEGKAILEDGSPATILPATATLEPWADAAAATPFTDDRSAQLWLNQYALRPEPQHLAALLRKSAAWAAHPYIRAGFPAYALAAAPAAAPTFAAGLRDADEPTRAMGVVALRWAGLDARALAATLGPEWTTRAEALSIRPDPLALEATAARLDETTARMDLAWAWFMATGRPEPIRAIVDLLRYRDDYSALRTAQATPGRKEAADPLARGVLYATAGWSLASFYATHVLAEDYVRLWREDGSVPAPIREELRTLLSNEAFRPPKQG